MIRPGTVQERKNWKVERLFIFTVPWGQYNMPYKAIQRTHQGWS